MKQMRWLVWMILCTVLLCALPIGAVEATDIVADTEGDWTYQNIAGAVVILRYNGADAAVTVPKTIGGGTVTQIGDRAFADNEKLVQITLPDSLTYIGLGAFNGCTDLKRVRIDDLAAWCRITIDTDVANLFSYATELYVGGKLLTDLVIPGNVRVIGQGAFSEYSGLQSVTIPETVDVIGYGAFEGCASLRRVTIRGDVQELFSCIFRDCTALTEVTLGKDLTTLGHAMFFGCSALPEISLPDGITEIPELAFADCEWLTEVKLPSSLRRICKNAFAGCLHMTYTELPEGLQWIEAEAFRGCETLYVIRIPDSVESIEEKAFYDCTHLTEITIGTGIRHVGKDAFFHTAYYNMKSRLDYIVFCGPCLLGYAQGMSGYLVIPKGTRVVADEALASAKGLDGVNFPEGMTDIGTNAFRDCPYIRDVRFPESLLTIGEGAFAACTLLGEVVFEGENGKTAIGAEAFYGCTVLETIELPDTLTRIGENAFRATAYFRNEENWEDRLLYCGPYVLGSDSRALPEGTVEVREGTKGIADATFRNARSLYRVILPESLEWVGTDAFAGLQYTAEICGRGKEEPFGWERSGVKETGNPVTWGYTEEMSDVSEPVESDVPSEPDSDEEPMPDFFWLKKGPPMLPLFGVLALLAALTAGIALLYRKNNRKRG